MKTAWVTPKNLAILVGIILAFLGGRFSNSPKEDTQSTTEIEREKSNTPRSASRSRAKRLPRVATRGAGAEAITSVEQLRDIMSQNGNQGYAMLQTAIGKMNSEELAELATDLADAYQSGRKPTNGYEIPLIFTRWAEVDPESALRFAKTSDAHFYTTAIQSVIAKIAQKDAMYALDEAKKIKNPMIANQVKNQVMSMMASFDPDAWVAEILSNPKNSLHHSYVGSYVAQWFQKDPTAAIARINRLPNYLIKNSVSQIGAAWAGTDSAAALQWAHELENEQMSNQAMTSIVSVIAKNSPEKAISLIENMPDGARTRALSNIYRAMAAKDPMGTFEQALALTNSADRQAALKSILNANSYGYNSHRWGSYYHHNNQPPQYTLEQLQAMVTRVPKGQIQDAVYGQMTQHLFSNTPEQNAELLRSFPETARQQMASTLIQQMTQTDPEGALKLYQSIPGIGRNNYSQYSGLLGALARINPEKAFKLAIEEKTENHRSNHLSSVMSQMTYHDPEKFVQLIATIDDTKLREHAISNMASQWGGTDPDAAINWANSLPVDERYKALTTLIPRLATNDPQLALSHYETLAANTGNDSSRKSSLSSVASSIASNWSSYDPEAAAAWVSTLADENAQRYAASSIVRNWVNQDIDKAGQWIDSLSDGKARDAGIQSLTSVLQNKNPAAAFDWAETISDDSQRKSTLSSVVRQWKQHNPEKARNAVEQANLTDKEYEYLIKQLKP